MTESTRPIRVLFLCTGNSCRSQMAEGFARALWPGRIDAHSAGLLARGLDRRAVQVMKESGVDIGRQHSKTLTELGPVEFDWVVTVCADADRSCPAFPAATHRLHRGFDDPPRLAAAARSEAEALVHYRRVRDQIRQFVLTLPATLEGKSPGAEG